MSNRAKAKGTAFESLIRDYLRSGGFPVERVPAGMAADRGDLSGLPGWTLQLKNFTDTQRAVRDGLAGLKAQQANADTPYGAVIVKRHGKSDPGKQLVVLELWQFAALLRRTTSQSSSTGAE